MLSDSIRARLWPTRKRFEGGQRQLREQLAELRGDLHDLHITVGALKDAQESLLGALNASELLETSRRMFEWNAEMRTRLRRTQALTARTYEAVLDWPAKLAAARESEAYERAYSEPEPLISIAVATYNSPDTLCDRALASVLEQSYGNLDVIVVGDCCTDDTEERVRAIGDERVRFHNLSVREVDPEDPWESWAVRGSIPRGTGIDLARGLWIAPMSQDDAWDADHLQTLLSVAREQRAELVYSRMRMVDAERPDAPPIGTCGVWPPRLAGFNCQSSLVNGALRFIRFDRACALASEPNDWNLARRAWEAGVRFRFVDRETSTLYRYPRSATIMAELEALGLPPSATAHP